MRVARATRKSRKGCRFGLPGSDANFIRLGDALGRLARGTTPAPD